LQLTQPWQRGRALALNAEARLALALGQPERVVHSLEQALAIAYDIADNDLAFNFLSNLLRVHLEHGDLDRAQTRLGEGLERFGGLHPRAESYLTYRLSELLYLRGDLGRALTQLQASIALADQLLDGTQQRIRRTLLANWFTRLGDPQRSRALCTELEGAPGAGITQLNCEWAHCEIAAGDLKPAQARLETALNGQDHLPEALATIHYLLAKLYNQLGQPARSLEFSAAQYPSAALETLNVAVRLEAMHQLQQPTKPLEDQAWNVLQRKPPPLEGLELYRSLIRVAKPILAKKARLQARKLVAELAATLSAQPELRQTFLAAHQDF
jgi:tetratricopeptide (TPR) repeat protein